MTTKKY